MNKIDKLKKFLNEEFKEKILAYNSRNLVGDRIYTIYDEDGITVDMCYEWNYIEIFGLTQQQFKDLLEDENVNIYD